ncbi:hypothetical protein [Methanospirillum lacunae]|uniref:Uncharacterized protein n=1 Tax=Methanospirillum lacunae TaxID=668570 RepID=A0A2V2MXU7_9EURY|nr:hypothetical protein [Methanospirillum lacunae]PWR72752.1 hypothetical protein DK846_07315 [Methanospirillum lacunae]
MKKKFFLIIILVLFIWIFGPVIADRLPGQEPENQIFSIDTLIDGTGVIKDKSSLKWEISSSYAIPTGQLYQNQSVAESMFLDSILTNGGKLSENKNFDFDSKSKSNGMYNVENAKVLTYASSLGAHMVGEDEYTLSVAGRSLNLDSDIRCVFTDRNLVLPSFCNIVSTKSNLINVNTAQVSSKGQIRSVGSTNVTNAGLNFQLAVSPDANSGSGFADGIVKTIFAGSIMEARDGEYSSNEVTWNKTAATNTWKDTTEVTSGIKNMQKAFTYQSGFRI